MRTSFILAAVAGLFAMSSNCLFAAPRDRSSVHEAIAVLDELAKTPEKCVPPALLRDADAVVIVPDSLMGGLVISARHGCGVLLIRGSDGIWSNPVFVKMTGASVGLQAGVAKTDIFLVIRSRRSLERIMQGNGKLTLGANASVAAGPIGRQASADTDAAMRAEILSYSRSRGIFAGVAFEGDTLRIDPETNQKFYGKRDVTVAEIVEGKLPAPNVGGRRYAASCRPGRQCPNPSPPRCSCLRYRNRLHSKWGLLSGRPNPKRSAGDGTYRSHRTYRSHHA